MSRTTTKTRDAKLTDQVLVSPVDRLQRRFRWRLISLVLLVLLALGLAAVVLRFTRDVPVTYRQPTEHFTYGSIGSEPGGSLWHPVGGVLPPGQIFAVLPDMFPDRLPGGYASLGLLYERNRDMPIGVSERQRLGFKMVGLNCAVCHVGSVRTSEGAAPRFVLGMPSHQLDLQRLFSFTVDSVLDPRFTAGNVTVAIERRFGRVSLADRLLLQQFVVPNLRERTLQLRSRIGRLLSGDLPAWGPGRVDTFTPYKALQFNWRLEQLPREELVAASDFPAIWNQRVRLGMHLHWDGNNASLAERNLSAGLGAGITPVTADHASIERVAEFLQDLPPPAWPAEFAFDQQKADAGRQLYIKHCAACHQLGGEKTGSVEPWEHVRPDRQRLDSYTLAFADNQNTLFTGTPHRFTHFRKTNGYANQPLDGLWARAPYLHNGSVPTLAALLQHADARPKKFYRGCDLYDEKEVGFVSNRAEENGRKYFEYDTSQVGNSNTGHEYGVDLQTGEKLELLEYLKTL